MPIYNASFLGNTGNVIASGRRSFFYTYHAEAGKVNFKNEVIYYFNIIS